MSLRLCVLVYLVTGVIVFASNHEWDMAVAIEDKVELLDKNATLVGLTYQVFKNLKAITFDDIRHQFIVSDMNEENDTIYRIRLSDTKIAAPILANLPDDVKDVAVDPVNDILYWTDSLHKKIMMLPLNDLEAKSQVLFAFKDEIPQGIAIDSCRRKLYWTNANHPVSTVERSNLDGTDREIIVKGNIFMPSGITIDQSSRRIYWADMGEGIYFRIESAKLDGSSRRIVYEDTHQTPFGIAVNEDRIIWTDLNSYALWGMKKDSLKPEILRRFNEKPMGIVTRNHDYMNQPECQEVVEAINGVNVSSNEFIVTAEDSDNCLNFGELTPFGCKCRRGYTGPRCEISLCHNLCLNGHCYLSTQGYPMCRCPIGFTGERCQYEMCKDFCMNGGTCKMSLQNGTWPVCQCQEGFSGSRCERINDFNKICDCQDGVVLVPVDGSKPICRCMQEETSSYRPIQSNLRSDSQLTESGGSELLDRFRDPLVMVFMFATVLLMLTITALTIAMCRMRHRRPRIKKRIIVNKNVTPLTCRPPNNSAPTEQCEITIENCCNMNICETPCFEPSQLRGFQRNKTEEKKTLLTSMENGEDLY